MKALKLFLQLCLISGVCVIIGFCGWILYLVCGAIDTSVATTLVITAQQSAASVIASEVVKLERYRVKITY